MAIYAPPNFVPLTQANAGTAGGTMSYINLGGIKMLWVVTANKTTGAGALSYTITLPTSFFSTVTYASCTPTALTGHAEQYGNILTQDATTITVEGVSPGGAATAGFNVLVIGT